MRTRALHRLAQKEGVVIDCHSGDDLFEATRQALKRATGGMIHFKISPYVQTQFADVLYDFDRAMFRRPGGTIPASSRAKMPERDPRLRRVKSYLCTPARDLLP